VSGFDCCQPFLLEQIRSEMNEAGLDLVFYNGGTCYGHAVGLVREERLQSTLSRLAFDKRVLKIQPAPAEFASKA